MDDHNARGLAVETMFLPVLFTAQFHKFFLQGFSALTPNSYFLLHFLGLLDNIEVTLERSMPAFYRTSREDDRMPDDVTPTDDFSDNSSFIDHLRHVHFTLIIACLFMWIAIGFQTPSSGARAYEQANQVKRLQDIWDDGRWLRNYANNQREAIYGKAGSDNPQVAVVEFTPPPGTTFDWFQRIFGNNLEIYMQQYFALTNSSLPNVERANNFSTINESTFSPLEIKKNTPGPAPSFHTLSDIIRTWNRLNQYRYFVILKTLKGGWVYSINTDSKNERAIKSQHMLAVIPDDKIKLKYEASPTRIVVQPGLVLRDELIQLLRYGPYGPYHRVDTHTYQMLN